MFKRVIFDNCVDWLPAVSFFLVFLVFLLAVVRALSGQKQQMQRLATLPIDDESPDQTDVRA